MTQPTSAPSVLSTTLLAPAPAGLAYKVLSQSNGDGTFEYSILLVPLLPEVVQTPQRRIPAPVKRQDGRSIFTKAKAPVQQTSTLTIEVSSIEIGEDAFIALHTYDESEYVLDFNHSDVSHLEFLDAIGVEYEPAFLSIGLTVTIKHIEANQYGFVSID
jgi:hypothetical protein